MPLTEDDFKPILEKINKLEKRFSPGMPIWLDSPEDAEKIYELSLQLNELIHDLQIMYAIYWTNRAQRREP